MLIIQGEGVTDIVLVVCDVGGWLATGVGAECPLSSQCRSQWHNGRVRREQHDTTQRR